jgi:hypothetical protein
VLARTAAVLSAAGPEQGGPSAYAVCHAATIVAADARQCQIQVADYAIGVAQPMNIRCTPEGTGVVSDESRQLWCRNTFDLRPKALLTADLLRPIYEKPQRMDTSAAMIEFTNVPTNGCAARRLACTDLNHPRVVLTSSGFSVMASLPAAAVTRR